METLLVLICLTVTANAFTNRYPGYSQFHKTSSKSPDLKYGHPSTEDESLGMRINELENAFRAFQDDQPLPDGSIRLVDADGNDTNMGRLEVIFFGLWGTVCDDFFDADGNASIVACREMGKPFGNVTILDDVDDTYGDVGKLPIWWDDVKCDGTEARLRDCGYKELGDESCSHSSDVGLHCKD